MSSIAIVGYSALGLLVVGWLWVSFSAPGPRRAVVEWLSATAMYGALVSLFTHLTHRAWEQDSSVALIAFGFLVLVFGSGLLVSLSHALLQLRGASREGQSATN